MFECANHPGGDAVWLCNGCEQTFCNDCMTVRRFGRTDVETCKGCGDMMVAVVAGVTLDEAADCPPLASATTWPLRGSGPMILGMGTLSLTLVGLFSVPAAFGLMLGYGMTVLQETGRGRQNVPDWPDFNGWGDVFYPPLLGLATMAISFGPAAWLAFEGFGLAALLPALALGAAYAPMAWMAASVSRRFLAITPLTVVPLLTRTNRSYWLGCVLLFNALLLGSEGARVVQAVPFPLDLVLGTATAFYVTMVQMRMLGLIWYRHREDFGLE